MLLEMFLTFKNEARNSRVLIYQYVTFVEITLDIYSPSVEVLWSFTPVKTAVLSL